MKKCGKPRLGWDCVQIAIKGLEMKILATQSSKRKENKAKLYFENPLPKCTCYRKVPLPKCTWYRNVLLPKCTWYRKRLLPKKAGTEKSWYRNVLLPKKAGTEMFRYRKVRTEMWNYRNVPYRNVKQPRKLSPQKFQSRAKYF